MEDATVKTKKIGGSLMVRIPKEIVETLAIGPNEIVKITVKKTKKPGFGLFKGIGPYRHEKVSDFD